MIYRSMRDKTVLSSEWKNDNYGVNTLAFKEHGVEYALDLGANVGTFAIRISPFVKTVYAFEPNSETYDLLIDNLKTENATNVVPLPLAVHPTASVLFLKSGITSIDDRYVEESTGERVTSAWNLDTIFGNCVIEPEKTLLKMDIEGGEGALLNDQRSIELIKRVPVLMAELHDEPTLYQTILENTLGEKDTLEVRHSGRQRTILLLRKFND